MFTVFKGKMYFTESLEQLLSSRPEVSLLQVKLLVYEHIKRVQELLILGDFEILKTSSFASRLLDNYFLRLLHTQIITRMMKRGVFVAVCILVLFMPQADGEEEVAFD